MIRRILAVFLVLATCLAASVDAAPAKRKTSGARKTSTAQAKAPTKRAKAPAARSKAPAGKAKASTAKSKATVGKAKASTARAKAPADTTRTAEAQARAKEADAASGASARSAAPRRLEDIHIEGEIPAPQVLFITARDQRRFTRFHHQRYLKTSAQVGETTQLPTRIGLTSPPPPPAGAP
jgi:hypothetical protein